MANWKKLASGAAGAAGGAGLDVSEVFSTYLYDGQGTTHSINNGIDLSGEGGMVWIKARSNAFDHHLFDTDRGATYWLRSNATAASTSTANTLTSFNSNGFTLGGQGWVDSSNDNYASWTFRKAPKFFTCVTYTGNSTNGRDIAHNLGSVPGCIIIKKTDGSDDWRVYHRGASDKYASLNSNFQFGTDGGNIFGDPSDGVATAPTSTHFTVSNDSSVNSSSYNYVAYLFAHNDGDGDFGPTGDQDIIKCGSYTGNGSASGPEINLGFEPQWLLIKKSTNTRSWILIDNMRNMSVSSDAYLYANLSNAEVNKTSSEVTPTATGFKLTSASEDVNGNDTYIYIAIRRGPMAVPTDATDVFAIDTSSSSDPNFTSGFPVDMTIKRDDVTASGDNRIYSRITNGLMYTNQTFSESSVSSPDWQFMNGYGSGGSASTNKYGWMWRRAPNFFDVVAYKGNGTNPHSISHNLGVAPELIIIKSRDNARSWTSSLPTGSGGISTTQRLLLNSTTGAVNQAYFPSQPTDTTFSVIADPDVNANNENYIAYLFASLSGVSKIGTYTGNGSTQTIDCGFSSGARFVLIKNYTSTDSWYVFDTTRGIVAGSDPYIRLNTTGAQGSDDWIDPNNSGFALPQQNKTNENGTSYIFYAIA